MRPAPALTVIPTPSSSTELNQGSRLLGDRTFAMIQYVYRTNTENHTLTFGDTVLEFEGSDADGNLNSPSDVLSWASQEGEWLGATGLQDGFRGFQDAGNGCCHRMGPCTL